MKTLKIFAITAMLSAFATASFAGSCCNKGKTAPKDCDKPKTETKNDTKKEEPAK